MIGLGNRVELDVRVVETRRGDLVRTCSDQKVLHGFSHIQSHLYIHTEHMHGCPLEKIQKCMFFTPQVVSNHAN